MGEAKEVEEVGVWGSYKDDEEKEEFKEILGPSQQFDWFVQIYETKGAGGLGKLERTNRVTVIQRISGGVGRG